MVVLLLPDAQRELPSLAAKALRGEEVVIAVGEKRLRLTPATSEADADPGKKRSGRGAWKGRVAIPDTFYDPWDAPDIGEAEA
jgi:antitoxin (DNA-binding transcriptional repressor) of toxin-antitoxin stability system